MELPAFLTIDDLATLLRVSPETIRRLARRGELPSVPGLRVRRFPREEILKLLNAATPVARPR